MGTRTRGLSTVHVTKRMDKPCVCAENGRVSKPVAPQAVPLPCAWEGRRRHVSARKRVVTWLQPALTHSTALSPETQMWNLRTGNLHGHWVKMFTREIFIASQKIRAHSKHEPISVTFQRDPVFIWNKAVFQNCLSSISHSLKVGT